MSEFITFEGCTIRKANVQYVKIVVRSYEGYDIDDKYYIRVGFTDGTKNDCRVPCNRADAILHEIQQQLK